MLYILNLALSYIVFAMIFNAPVRTNPGNLEFFLTVSSTKDFKLLNGLSKTTAFIYMVLPKYKSAVTAPIDLPHTAKSFILGFYFKYSTTSRRSSC